MLLPIKTNNKSLGILHFVGIGGIGMSAIAQIMHNLGYKITGSDICSSANTLKLENMGIKIFYSHEASNIEGASYIVKSSSIGPENSEIKEAIEKQIPVIKRSQMLAELMRLKSSIAISGSHGKTTITSLTACIFEAAGHNPTVINGGIINSKKTNAYLGSSDYLIAEADESDATFINIPSTIAVITSIDPEHLDYYGSFTNLMNAFEKFILNLPFYGFAVCCADHENVRKLCKKITNRKIITYAIDNDEADIRGYNINLDVEYSTFDIKITGSTDRKSRIVSNIKLPVAGRHNVLNSLSSIAIAAELGFSDQTIQNAFINFSGVKRRFTHIGKALGADIIDDYAHHPDEIIATLETAQIIQKKRGGRIIAVFQPHRYSRLKILFNEFISSLKFADIIINTDIYSAGEAQLDNLSGEVLHKAIKEKYPYKITDYIKSSDNMNEVIKQYILPKDMVVFMGAGDISAMAYKFVKSI